jgi:trans-aconitate methyltransferase
MEDKWKEIWNRRNATEIRDIYLNDLIALDGFDTGAGKIEIDDWREYARRVSEKLNLKAGCSVYEIGCGAGAFLYALCEKISLKVGGNDYGSGLIDTAKRVLPHGEFQCIEAAKIDTTAKYDYVISNSVFHYFDLDYARQVLLRMLDKADRAVCVLELPDLRTKDLSEKARRDILSPAEYEKKYAGLEHTYYDRTWFSAIAAERGMKCETFDGCVPRYAQNQFRFGCLILK